MRDVSQRSTRRGFLGTLALAAASSAGCSGFGASSGQSDPTGASGSSPETAAPTRTPTEADHEHGHDHSTEDSDHDEAHTHEDHADAAGPLGSFESSLRERFVDVESLSVEDGRVRLTYVTQSTRSHEIAAGIETVVVSFVQAYADDWRVDGLDAKLIEPSGTVMGYWRTETRWARPVVSGHETRTALLERTLDTYHGRLTRDHSHGDGGSENSEGAHDHSDGDGEHSHDETDAGHSHGDGSGDHAHEPTGTGHTDG
ncbi:hypothetical protein [Haloarcula salina]|uniref:hypothetical protein n=1 Tax=Haloarcula salina TaxID=1429914 RepID=UPI001F50B565|nr:hypothetical protein [Haloarcula salina]